jgi:peptide-methionine (S)-S-oxide reductase
MLAHFPGAATTLLRGGSIAEMSPGQIDAMIFEFLAPHQTKLAKLCVLHRMRKAESMTQPQNEREIATLGGGCFWCLEAVFDDLKGVESVESGYMGGHMRDPSYAEVCSGNSGHAEVVQISFDPAVVSFREILEVFFVIHDPTTRNRQGNDAGPQYRSAIFHHSPEQKAIAGQVIARIDAAGLSGRPVVTEVTAAGRFYIAEAEHQEYYQRNPYQPYCMMAVEPKVVKFRKHFIDKLKK